MPILMPGLHDGKLLHSPKIAGGILAAGVATRLEPISAVIAKPAFPLGGKVPLAELWVRKFVEAGINNLAMNLHRVPESIRGYFGDGQALMAKIRYAFEPTPTGTLGGAFAMLDALRKDGVTPELLFVPSGDIGSGIGREHLEEMVHMHRTRGAAVTMLTAPIPWDRRKDFGTAVLEGIKPGAEVPAKTYARIERFVEKDPNSPSNLNNASCYLIDVKFLEEYRAHLTACGVNVEEPCYDFGKHVFPSMLGDSKLPHLASFARFKEQLFAYEPGMLWFDVGNKRDYLSINEAVLRGELPVESPYRKVPWGFVGTGVQIDFNKTKINAPVVIGNNCRIFPGAEIGPYTVVGDGWVVGARAKIDRSVLWEHYSYREGEESLFNSHREIREGTTVSGSIVTGGIISGNITDQTVDQLLDGSLRIDHIDWVPAGKRA